MYHRFTKKVTTFWHIRTKCLFLPLVPARLGIYSTKAEWHYYCVVFHTIKTVNATLSQSTLQVVTIPTHTF
jgi:hypothetical protein